MSASPSIEARFLDKQADALEIAAEIATRPNRLDEVLAGIQHRKPAVRYGCCKVLRVLAADRPGLLYPHYKLFVALLDHDNNIMRWEGIHVLGWLAAVDRHGRITRLLPRLYEMLNDRKLVTAANTVGALAKIAQAKPKRTDEILEACIARCRKKFDTLECRQVFIGQVLDACVALFEQSRNRDVLRQFALRARRSTRPATVKRAEKALACWQRLDRN